MVMPRGLYTDNVTFTSNASRAAPESPTTWICSRPTSALNSVVSEEKVSMLLVEHDVAMVLGLSARVTVLDFGVCIAEGSPDEIRNDPAVRAAYLGDDEAVEGVAENEAASAEQSPAEGEQS